MGEALIYQVLLSTLFKEPWVCGFFLTCVIVQSFAALASVFVLHAFYVAFKEV